MLSPYAIEDDCIVQDMPNMSTQEVKVALKQWVDNKSLPGQVSIFSSFITNLVQIAEIYESMSYIPADNNYPLNQEILFIKSKEKVLTLVLVEEGGTVHSRLTSLENSENFLKYSHNPILKEQEAIKKTEKQLLEKSLTKVMNNNGEGDIEISFRQSKLDDLEEYVKECAEKFNNTETKEKLVIKKAKIQGDHHFQIVAKEWEIGAQGVYLPNEEEIEVFFIQKGKEKFVLLPTLDEEDKVKVYGKNFANSGLYIQGLWYNMTREKK